MHVTASPYFISSGRFYSFGWAVPKFWSADTLRYLRVEIMKLMSQAIDIDPCTILSELQWWFRSIKSCLETHCAYKPNRFRLNGRDKLVARRQWHLRAGWNLCSEWTTQSWSPKSILCLGFRFQKWFNCQIELWEYSSRHQLWQLRC